MSQADQTQLIQGFQTKEPNVYQFLHNLSRRVATLESNAIYINTTIDTIIPIFFGSADLTFANRDSVERFTIPAPCTPESIILTSVIGPNTSSNPLETEEDKSDPGIIYTSTIVRRLNGSFEIIVARLSWGYEDSLPIIDVIPSLFNTVKLNYVIKN